MLSIQVVHISNTFSCVSVQLRCYITNYDLTSSFCHFSACNSIWESCSVFQFSKQFIPGGAHSKIARVVFVFVLYVVGRAS